ncbi:hypothetical protein H681_15550 [Pseudomonas sp. ATCC 13867]|uniref:DUF5801 repeats-in-toxin domain-containing protein n=1 Tax=Pseudomonas sp. ATCC 13867 TaxID=1294143 RepID=UPI0002C4F4C9|nr:DUF5801 repeats-in-toxin domain-containing protein [Pseudomonas sp. ATCC 13867]AGI24978.1 hypothetical protein H681_15550 [Pseudomonas sp. ATCC 13867]
MATHKKNASSTSDASVSTDQQDYAPGSTASITANGFAAGSTVMFQVRHATSAGPDGTWGTPDDVLDGNAGAGHAPWYVTDGGAGDLDGKTNGSVITSWYVNPDDSAGATFQLSAASTGADQTFGTADDTLAMASFTDSGLITVTPGVLVTLDETTELQNAIASSGTSGDADDNDILLSRLPTTFSDRLAELEAGTAMGAALSGYTGAVGDTGSTAFSLSGANITDVSFVGVDGKPLDGDDSGLLTLDGTSILLYTDTDNNILLGRAGENGAIVFAAYIEEIKDSPQSPPTGGKIWTVEYQPIQHSDATDPDDALDLHDTVFIGASQDLTFSLENAPSGQNLFLMYTTASPQTYLDGNTVRISSPAIIATGKNPADQSAGANITSGDTINTSQGGGPTTFGTNNQMIVEQEGIRFTFVTGAKQSVTIPNLDQNEADVEANIDFTGLFDAKAASFDVVQLQSGKSAVVKISAFTTDKESGVDFVNGYSDDSAVEITSVRVINKSTGQVIENSDGSVNDGSIVITIASGIATITGVKAGYKIEYTTQGDHNRVLVENGAALNATGNTHADFDIGGFMLVQVAADHAEIGSRMIFEDDGPSIAPSEASAPTLTTDDTHIPDSAGPTSLANLFTSNFGTDGFKDTDHDHIQDADAITYSLGVSADNGVDSGLVDTLSGDKIYLFLENGSVVGRVGTAAGQADPTGDIALTIAVDSNTGAVTLTQNNSVVHDDPQDPAETGTSAAGLAAANLVTLTATITDGDGDTASTSRDIGDAFKFEDDGPSITPSEASVPTLTTDDTHIPDSDGPTSFADLFNPDFGKDGFKDADDDNVQDADAVTYALGVSADNGVDSGLVDTLSGDKIYLFLENGSVVGRVGTAAGQADPTGDIALTIAVDANTGAVTLTQNNSVVHDDPLDPAETSSSAAGLAAANLVTLTATITDGDGDTASTSRDIGDAFKFEDDGPSITPSEASVPTLTTDDTHIPDSAGPTSFADLFNPDFGKDGFKDADDDNAQDADAISYSLGVSADNGVDSGLVDTLSGDKIYLFLENGSVVGRVGTSTGQADPAGDIALTIAVDANTGTVTLTQNNSVVHDDPQDPAETGTSAAGLAAANLVTLTATITDGDGDTASTSRDIGDAFKFEDDGPSITPSEASVPTLTTDDTHIPDSDGPTSFADLFSPDFGMDGFKDADDDNVQDADAVTYALGVSADNGVDSGLVDTLSGDKIYLYLENGTVVGRVGTAAGQADPTGDIALTIAVDANTGAVTLTQNNSVVHDDPQDPAETGTSAAGLAAANLVTLTVTITDGDGDTASTSRDIGDAFKFEDDGPSITPSEASAPTLTTDDTHIPDSAGPTSFADLFNPDFGKDGFKDADDDNAQDADAISYSLGVSADNGVDSGLVDTLSGDKIYLFLENGSVVGRVGTAAGQADPTGDIALTIAVDSNTGAVTLTQNNSVVHDDPQDPAETGTSAAGLAAANLVTLTATITDGDGDTASTSRDIGDAFKFEDDGPSITPSEASVPTLTTDDTHIPDSAGPTSFADLFNPDFGKDGFKDADDDNVQDADAVTYSLGVSADGGVDSGLVDSQSGHKIYLYLQNGAVLGRVGTAGNMADPAGDVALMITVAANTGAVTLTQNNSVMHNDPLDPVEAGASAAGLAAANLITLTATITDGDGDTASVSRDIGSAFRFEDDGPSLAFGNLVGTGSVLPQLGYWDKSYGTDGLGAAGLDISLVNDQFTLVRPDNSTATGSGTLTEQSPSPDANGAFHFDGTLTADFNNDGTTDPAVHYTLTAFADGTYTLDLLEGFSSTHTLSSANGSLDAGGPDPVRTLTIGTEHVVFFAAVPTALPESIQIGIGSGEDDLTETQLQTDPLPSYIGTAAMNVSTSGIGIANNNFEGNNTTGINAGDESFVVNPETLLTSMKVFIDNSLQGYNPATEELYYTIYYSDDTISGAPTKVLAGDLTAEAGNQQSFTIQAASGKMIDAVQLTMGKGAVKIPVIEFTQQVENLASDIQLSFNATVTDKDGDTATSAFTANLFANEKAGSTFDFTLAGIAGTQEAFNVDLSRTEGKYEVTGFDVTAGQRDTLVLNGDQNAVVDSIDTSGANSVVTVTESGGQVTTITLVGVDILNTDIVHGSV